jgi:Gpi18-like mannosyltransferase
VRFQSIIANDNGPLALLPLTAVAAIASWLGRDDTRLLHALVLAVFSIFTLLMSREAVAAIDRLRGASLAGFSRVLAYGVFAASPTLLISVLGYGHVEQPIMLWLVLLAVRRLASDRPRAAGIWFGLALLTRSLAAVPLIPLGLLLLARGRWRAAAWLAGSAASIVTLGLLPFLLADPTDTTYSLLTHRASLPVGGGSIWQLLVGTPYQWIPQHWDILFVLGFAVMLSLIVIVARKDFDSSRDLYGLLALTALTLPLLAKSVWPYYFLDTYVFGAVWWLGQVDPLALGRRLMGAAVPVIATIGTMLTEYEMDASRVAIRLSEGVAMGTVLAVLMAVLAGRLRRERVAPEPRPNLRS